jgi:predicted GNAT family N-acyltransferase
MSNSLRVEPGLPSVAEYIQLRDEAGWGLMSDETATISLEGSLYGVCLHDQDTLVGFARLVGDGVLYFYISDVIVSSTHGGKGYGSLLMTALMDYIHAHAQPGATIALLSAPGLEPFYSQFGFTPCPNKIFGQGLSYVVGQEC